YISVIRRRSAAASVSFSEPAPPPRGTVPRRSFGDPRAAPILPRQVVEPIGDRGLPLLPVFATRRHLLRGIVPGQLARRRPGRPQEDSVDALLHDEGVPDPVAAQHPRRQPHATRV